ncbi:Acetaldehyde dehydrogenase 2 [Janthinobacterium lividum]|nr:Acetaldehyde dehydrogenase 2 [Janthinobacterium lividum]
MNLADISKLGVANPFKQRYDNYIGGKFVAPVKVNTFPTSPITGLPFCEIARSTAEDVELAWTRPMPPRMPGARRRLPSAPIS